MATLTFWALHECLHSSLTCYNVQQEAALNAVNKAFSDIDLATLCGEDGSREPFSEDRWEHTSHFLVNETWDTYQVGMLTWAFCLFCCGWRLCLVTLECSLFSWLSGERGCSNHTCPHIQWTWVAKRCWLFISNFSAWSRMQQIDPTWVCVHIQSSCSVKDCLPKKELELTCWYEQRNRPFIRRSASDSILCTCWQ